MNFFKTKTLLLVLIIAVGVFCTSASYAQKVGSTSMQFLKVMPSARATALGEAYTVWATGAEAIFWNPAGLARLDKMEFSINYIDWLFDSQQGALSYGFAIPGFGVIGLQVQYVDFGDFEETSNARPYISDPDNPGLTGRSFSPFSYLVGISYARDLTDKFSLGISMKYAHESLFDGQKVTAQVKQGVFEEVETWANGLLFDFGIRAVGGSGNFTLNKGATLATARADGIAGAMQSTGTVTFDDGANYIFNGTAAQVTSVLLPLTVNGLTIENAAGVALSQGTTINGVLRLVAGVFDNTIPFTLGPNGTISYDGGSLLVPTSVEQLPDVPTEFALKQNYPNPFNPATTIRYDVPNETHVTLRIYDVMGREVAELVNEKHSVGAYEIVWNAKQYASGVYYFRISAGDFVSMRKLVLMK